MGGGDSAGGQMTAGLALMLRDRGMPQLTGQVLIYPVLGADIETPSYGAMPKRPVSPSAEMNYYLEAFLGPRRPQLADPYAVPLLATDLRTLLPPSSPSPHMIRFMMTACLITRRLLEAAGTPVASAPRAGAGPLLYAGAPCERAGNGRLQGDRRRASQPWQGGEAARVSDHSTDGDGRAHPHMLDRVR